MPASLLCTTINQISRLAPAVSLYFSECIACVLRHELSLAKASFLSGVGIVLVCRVLKLLPEKMGKKRGGEKRQS
jgi:hypothetical protein